MSLKKKTIVMVFAVFLLSGALDFAVQQLVIMPSFHDLEREEAMKNVGRVLESINRELQVISIAASDWAYWDDLYHFAAGENPDFLKTTMNQSALENAKVNLMNVYDPEGKLVWGKAMALPSGEALDFGYISAPELPSGHPLLNLPEITSEVSGLFRTSYSPLMLVAKHILTNERKGPANGTYVLGRFLDEAAIQRISEQVRLKLSIDIIPDGEQAADWSTVNIPGVPYSPIMLKEGNGELLASTVIPDVHGRPFLSVSVATPRAITARGKSAVLMAILSVGSAGLLVMGLLMFMLHRTILSPLARLTRHSVQLGETDDLLSRLAFDRKDEIGVLANAFDQMIGRLAEARRKLVDQSFHSGIAEMASGVLHNIGNAMTPLQVKMVTLNDELLAAPVEEMKTAVLELSDTSTEAERKNDLMQFVELAGSEMAGTIGRSLNHVADIMRQVQYVQRILTDQERYSRSARVVTPLSMQDVVLDSAQALSPPMRAAIEIEVDPSVERAGRVIGSRAALQQVVSNLLVNAAESIRESGVAGGRIIVHAASEVMDGASVAHFCFEDNGKGIHEEDLKRIFERDFSTKGRSSGLGLHWSANTVSALNGLLYAESDGFSRGARLHLLLPLAIEEQAR